MQKWKLSFLLTVILFLYSFSVCFGIWNQFDLVRPFEGGWGSQWNISFVKYSLADIVGTSVGNNPNLGSASAMIGDLDGDGVNEILVGAPLETFPVQNGTKHAQNGAVYILYLDRNATLRNVTKIASNYNGGPTLYSNDNFGASVANVGDLDGDGIDEIAVGAPGQLLAAVYIMYLYPNGTARNYVMIRGHFIGQIPPNAVNYTFTYNSSYANGPSLRYQSKFGSSLAALGDYNRDGYFELAVGQLDASGGNDGFYILILSSQALVLNYTFIGNEINGGPSLGSSFSLFGCSIVAIGDIDGDNITDLAVGARYLDSVITSNFHSGTVFVLFMNRNGTVKSYTRNSELAVDRSGTNLPFLDNYECGSSVGFIGDINHDNWRQHRPKLLHDPLRRSINDIITGCPQTLTDAGTGMIFLLFLEASGSVQAYTPMPDAKDIQRHVAPMLSFHDRFGASVAGYQDIDGNGLREILVGAPGDHGNDGALYLLFPRRRRFHPPIPDFLRYILTIVLPISCCVCSCVSGVAFFFWYFRRKPDEVEIAVKKAGVEITKERKRKKKEFGKDGKVYADDYVA